MLATVSVNEQGQITLPLWLREHLNIQPNSQVQLDWQNSRNTPITLSIKKAKPQSGFGMLKTNLSDFSADFDVAHYAKDNLDDV